MNTDLISVLKTAMTLDSLNITAKWWPLLSQHIEVTSPPILSSTSSASMGVKSTTGFALHKSSDWKTDPKASNGKAYITGSSVVANKTTEPQGLQHAVWTLPERTVHRSGIHFSVFHTLKRSRIIIVQFKIVSLMFIKLNFLDGPKYDSGGGCKEFGRIRRPSNKTNTASSNSFQGNVAFHGNVPQVHGGVSSRSG